MIDLEIKRINTLLAKIQGDQKSLVERLTSLESSYNALDRRVFLQDENLAKLYKYNEMYKRKLSKKIKKQEITGLKADEITEENIERVKLMAVCMTKEQIARCFNVSLNTYLKREEELPALKEAYEVGRHLFMAEATSKLVEHIRNGDTKSLFYYLNNVMKLEKENNNEMLITIAKTVFSEPLKIVGDGDYEKQHANNFAQIMSIKVNNSNIDDEDKET